MTIKPMDDRVVIEPKDVAEKTVGGIIIPDTAKERPNIGEIIAVGTDEELKEIVKVGDKILYAKYGGTEIELEGEKYLIVSRNDILAIIE
ncbi:MAG: co-chaperone GroES [Candidatus Cloacimonadota bacterium]|nr:MAG: co-chaperone GroES [Candidatus Cloacimonadota bacterium]